MNLIEDELTHFLVFYSEQENANIGLIRMNLVLTLNRFLSFSLVNFLPTTIYFYQLKPGVQVFQ